MAVLHRVREVQQVPLESAIRNVRMGTAVKIEKQSSRHG